MARSNKKSEDPSIDDMLASIRQAIHAETERENDVRARISERENRQPQLSPPTTARTRPVSGDAPVSGTMREMRVSLRPSSTASSEGSLTTRSEDFLAYKNKLESLRKEPRLVPGSVAEVLGGDTRLEDAINQVSEARARRQASQAEEAAKPHQPAPAAPQPAEIRASVEDYTRDDFEVINAPPLTEKVQPQAVNTPPQQVVPPQAPVVQQPVAPEPAEPQPAVAQAAVEPQPVQPEPQPAQQPVSALPSPMMSDAASQLAGAAFERLADELFKKADGGKTVLEDGASDLLRPMLKKWLDENLPSLVERLVREEIERVARRGGR